MKSNRWKSRVEVTCKGGFVYKERLKSIELSRAWSFYLSSSSSLSGAIRPSGHCIPQSPNIYLTPQIIYLNLSLNSQRPSGLVTCIILMHLYHPDAFVPSWYASWFQTCTCRGLCIWSRSGLGLRTLSGLEATGLLPRRPSSFSSGILTFLKTKLTSAQGRSPSCV